MKSEPSNLLPHRVKRRKRDTRELAARLAPLEEQRTAEDSGDGAQSDRSELVTQVKGAIVVGNTRLHLPEDLMEGQARRGFLGVEPFVLVIVGLMLVFIIFITWQVSRM